MNEKSLIKENRTDSKKVPTDVIVLLLLVLFVGGWMLKLDLKTSETQEMIQEQQAMLFALETLPRQPRANASGQLYLNVPWLKIVADSTGSIGIACKITGQTTDTTWKTDSTYQVERNVETVDDTLWDFRE